MERGVGARVNHIEIWDNSENHSRYEAVGGQTLCGGVPFFFNTVTKQSICGAARCDALIEWAKGLPRDGK
jgi:hypothetical protein